MQTDTNDILHRLAEARRRDNSTLALKGFFIVCTVVLAATALGSCIEAFFWLNTTMRTVVVTVVVLAGVGGLLLFAAVPLARRVGVLPGEPDDETARRVGTVFPAIHDRLKNAVQLARKRAELAPYYSDALLDAAIDDANAEVHNTDFLAIVDRRPMRQARTACMLMCATAGMALLVFPTLLGGAAYRLVHFREDFHPPAAYSLEVLPGNKDVVKGESVEVIVRVAGKTYDPVILLLQPEGQVTTDAHTLTAGSDATYRYRLEGIRLSTAYQVQSGNVESEEYQLRVLDRPSIAALNLRLVYPRHTGLGARDLEENIGEATAPTGTTIHIRVKSTKPIASAVVRFDDSTHVTLRCAETSAEGSLTLRGDRSYRLDIVDSEGLHNADPIEYTLHVIPDAYPTVTIAAPGMNMNVAGNERLPMVLRLTDDYGIAHLRLAHRLIHSRYEAAAREFTMVEIPVSPATGTAWLVTYEWELAQLRLSPEDVVEYHAEVVDNDAVTGPKSAVSETFTLRLPSLDEVFAEADKAHDVSEQNLDQALKQAQDARKELDDLSREMKKQQKLNWNEQKKAEDLTRRYDDIKKKIEEVQHTVDKMVDEMQKNRTLSLETLQKYTELQEMMQQIASPEFAEAMKRLQQSMQQMNPQAMQQALQQFQFSEEQFRKSMERTLNLLKRIQIEQKMDEMLKRTEAMEKAQGDLHKEMSERPPGDATQREKAAREQEDLRKQAEALDHALDSLAKKMEEFPGEMPVKEMQQLQSMMEKNGMQTSMQQSAQEIQQGDFQQAQAQQQQSLNALSAMKQGMQQMKQQMLQNQQRQIVQEMQRATRDLLELSKREEALKNQSRGLDPASQQFRENAQQQMDALRDLGNITNRLGGLSQKTFSITPEMGKSIGDAMRQMSKALESLAQRNGAEAGQQQGAAMGSLNETAQQLQEAIQGMMQPGGQGMGMAGFMQRLQRLAGMQQGINDASQGLTPQQAAEMARLAGEQGMVRKSLEELAREANRTGDMSKLLGDLNRIAQDMREVQTDLAQGNINPETLHKQERILSRMLDAQRSMRERDFEKRRKAESGTDVARQGPAALDPSTQEGRDRLQRDLLRALEEGYNKDYEELIRKYFETLQK